MTAGDVAGHVADHTAEPGHPHRRRILAICCLSLVLIVVAVSSLNTALPALQRGLDASHTELLWIVDAYALVFAATLLPAGALGDRFGRKGAFLAGLAVFGTGALMAGLSSDAVQVVASRGVMGVGAGFVMPATLSIITTVFPRAERAKAIAVWAGFAGAGGALGPLVSGLVLEVWAWSAVFHISLPVVAALVLLVAYQIPTSSDPEHTRLDPFGAGLSAVALFALLFAIIQGPEEGWTALLVLGAFAAAASAVAAFVAWELRSSHPLLDPRLFRLPGFAAGAVTITGIFFVMFGMFFLIPQYLQYVQGYSALEAAVRLLPSGLTLIVVAPRGPRLARRIGPERSVALGLALAAGGFVLLTQLDPGTGYGWLAAALVLMACGSGLAMPPSTAAIVSSLPPAKAGVGSAVNDVTREVGGAVGIAVLGSIVSVSYRNGVAATSAGLPDSLRHVVDESLGAAIAARAPADVLVPAQAAFSSAANSAFTLSAVVMLAGSLLYLRLHRVASAAAATIAPSAGAATAVVSSGTAVAPPDGEAAPTVATADAATSESAVPCCR